MVLESQIIDKLKVIDSYRFERLIDNLLHQGAFPEIVPRNSFIESFGVNVEKERTIKSASHADAEVRYSKTVIEKSVEGNWAHKLGEVIRKNKGKTIRKFIFATNQDTANKVIRVNGKQINAEEYCKEELTCQEVFIIGQKDLLLKLQNPEFLYIRRNFLAVPGDFFFAPNEFLQQIRSNNFLLCDIDEDVLKQHSRALEREISFSPGEITVLHNDEYVILLHALGLWAKEKNLNSTPNLTRDFSFINWPRPRADLQDIDDRELNSDIETFVIIWGAHEIKNLSEYLKFAKSKTSLIFVTKTSFKDGRVISQLRSFGNPLSIREVSIPAIDKRTVSSEEMLRHETKIKLITRDTIDTLLRFEALIYFYSPLYLTDSGRMREIAGLLQISETQLKHFKEMLLKNDLAAITGNIIWLKQSSVAKTLLNDFINKGIFSVETLV